MTAPISPEVSSTFSWTGGQLLGAVFIIIMDALKGGWDDQPEGSMKRALVFEAVVAWVVVPCVFFLGIGGGRIRLGRGGAVGTTEG